MCCSKAVELIIERPSLTGGNWHADEDRLQVRRHTQEQDKHLDVISDALSDLQRIGEVDARDNAE